jgi:hypothetical protein
MALPPAMPVAEKVRIVLPVLAAPVLARLPAALGYRIACWNGDLLFRYQARKRAELVRNLQLVLGNELSPAAAQQIARDWFRLTSCRAVDVKRLRREARPLRRLVEIHGREHLEAALAAGKGEWLLGAARQRLPDHLHRAPDTYLRGRPLIRRAVVLGTGPLQAGAAPPAAAEHRASAWPTPGRGAGSRRTPRQ